MISIARIPQEREYMSPTNFGPKFSTIKLLITDIFDCVLFACLAALPIGFDASMLLSLSQFRKQFGYEYQGDYVVRATYKSLWNGVLVPGGLLGSAIAGPISSLYVLIP